MLRDARREVLVGPGEPDIAIEHAGSGPLIICLHGFPDGPSTFRHLGPQLRRLGLRVAVPSMRGYAPSGRAPDGDYRIEALGRDVLRIARHLSPNAPVHLVGHDWGALAAYAAVAAEPNRVASLTTVAVPHPRCIWRFLAPLQLRQSAYIGRFWLPGAAATLDRDRIEQLWREWSPRYRCPPEVMTEVVASIVPRADDVLAYYRALPGQLPTAPTSPLLRRFNLPSLYVHGRHDGCVALSTARGCELGYRDVTVALLDGGHFVHLEQPEAFGETMARFLRPHLA